MTQFGQPIERRVLDALRANDRTRELAIDVVGRQGVITLKGTVPSEEARAIAESIAERQEGVEEVINDLNVEKDDEGPQVAYPPRSG